MAWEEWEQLKAVALERRSTQMRLNQLPADQGGTSGGGAVGDLRSDRAAWAKAGEEVGSLRSHVSKALAKLDEGQKGLGSDSGCQTATAQREVHASWERYVKAVTGRCGKLAGLLDQVGRDQLRTDEAIKSEIQALTLAYEDTPAVGAGSEGR
ncbi:hypothetical protein [Streptomyces anandii]|uniref:hypothetical protein n=1 Tax=Streptomyces anandii TaxID=285454 RepID=UPI0036769099